MNHRNAPMRREARVHVTPFKIFVANSDRSTPRLINSTHVRRTKPSQMKNWTHFFSPWTKYSTFFLNKKFVSIKKTIMRMNHLVTNIPQKVTITSTHHLQIPKPQISVLLSFPTVKLATKVLVMHTNTNHSDKTLTVTLLLRLLLLNSTFL
ncbi:hypothetical protein VIGAN_02064500 [Vigna angularis var. angularis]|uniref:Uncharacterized protein n=1 Tax=Vigna angularis var. angularis TaxID=157739 RepID=A0A0S3RBJ6_PHAAN|nr:hypothetical protein VIGAN_02064500 [Vigna angularis var. angularis]